MSTLPVLLGQVGGVIGETKTRHVTRLTRKQVEHVNPKADYETHKEYRNRITGLFRNQEDTATGNIPVLVQRLVGEGMKMKSVAFNKKNGDWDIKLYDPCKTTQSKIAKKRAELEALENEEADFNALLIGNEENEPAELVG